MNLRELRREYARAGLHEDDLASSPFDQFTRWFKDIDATEQLDSTAMVLGTVDPAGQVHQRIVLLKSYSEQGFIFFSNYLSQKGKDIEQNSSVNLLFAWHAIDRQVIIQGEARKTSAEESDEYFQSRPRGSQIAASISEQSEPVDSRTVLEDKFAELDATSEGKIITRPESWGGYIVIPNRFEFWQGRESRLHDRLVYKKEGAAWAVERLCP